MQFTRTVIVALSDCVAVANAMCAQIRFMLRIPSAAITYLHNNARVSATLCRSAV
jgi:hypothetical protein